MDMNGKHFAIIFNNFPLATYQCCEGGDGTSLGVGMFCDSCGGGSLTSSAGLTGGVRICCRGEGERAATGGNTEAVGWWVPIAELAEVPLA
jgi:hypothetical protein